MKAEGAGAKGNVVVCPECKKLLDKKDYCTGLILCYGCGRRFVPSDEKVKEGETRKEMLDSAFRQK